MPPKTTATLDAGLAHFEVPKIFAKVKLPISTAVFHDATKYVGQLPAGTVFAWPNVLKAPLQCANTEHCQ